MRNAQGNVSEEQIGLQNEKRMSLAIFKITYLLLPPKILTFGRGVITQKLEDKVKVKPQGDKAKILLNYHF